MSEVRAPATVDDPRPRGEASDQPETIPARWLTRLAPLAVGALLLAGLLVVIVNRRSEGDGTPHRLVGQPAPPIVATTWDGAPVDLSAYRGRVVVLNFWAEWCEPCRDEMPAFQRVAERRPDVVILGINLKSDDEERARRLVRELGVTYPIIRDAAGTDPRYGPIELAFGSTYSYPMTVFIRPDGTIDAIRIGELDEAEIEQRITDAAT